jgi:hypothetical protein
VWIFFSFAAPLQIGQTVLHIAALYGHSKHIDAIATRYPSIDLPLWVT